MSTLTRDGFLKRCIVRPVQLENGDTVHIRALPASIFIDAKEENFSPGMMLARSLCDADGVLFFSENEKESALSLDVASLQIVMAAINDLNGLGAAEKSAMSKAEKNSVGGMATAPATSPSPSRMN